MKKFITIAISALLASCNGSEPVKDANEVKIQNDTTGCDSISAEKYASADTSAQKQVYEFLKSTKTYYLATAEGDQPRVRPFGTVNIFENKLYIQTGLKKNVAKQIEKNNKVEICAFDGDRWIRISATLEKDDRFEAKKSMLDAYPDLRGMYSENDGNTVVFYMTNAEAKISSFREPEQTLKF